MRHHWLHPGERVVWHALANRGADNTRQVGGRLYLTDRRLVFEPALLERVTQERPWEAPLAGLEVALGPGSWTTEAPVVREVALRHHLHVRRLDGAEEDFFLAHVGAELAALAARPGSG